MKELELSVIVPTYNRRDILALTLPALLAQDFPAGASEIIVVVDGSTDGTVEMLQSEFPEVRAVRQPNLGLAAARNAGIKAAGGRLVLLLDDDMQCDPAHFHGHASAHEGGPAIVEGGIDISADSADMAVAFWRHRMVSAHYEGVRSKPDERWPWQAIRFANTSMPRALLVDLGGFDERFRFYHEDLELGLRLAATGSRYVYIPELSVRHLYRKSIDDVIDRDQAWNARNTLMLCQKHPAYRRFSALAGLRAGPWWKRWPREAGTRSRISPDLLLRPSYAMARKIGASRPAAKILDLRSAAQFFRVAATEAGSWQALRRDYGVRLPVLMYHHVGPRSRGATPAFTVSPERFASQMAWMARNGYSPIRCTDWIGWCREQTPLPEKPVLLTFDDGYADLVEFALPVLRQYRFPATIFVVTGLTGSTNRWDKAGGLRGLPLMSAGEIRNAAAEGIEFGSHSRNHFDLTTLSRRQLEDEIGGSKSDLEEIAGRTPTAFAYPFGCHNDQVRGALSHHFSLAFGVNQGINTLDGDPLAMNRVAISGGHPAAALNWLLRFGIDPVAGLRAAARPRTRLRHAILCAKAAFRTHPEDQDQRAVSLDDTRASDEVMEVPKQCSEH